MTQGTCNKVFGKSSWTLIYFPDWLLSPKMLDDLDDDEGVNEFVEWYHNYKQSKMKIDT